MLWAATVGVAAAMWFYVLPKLLPRRGPWMLHKALMDSARCTVIIFAFLAGFFVISTLSAFMLFNAESEENFGNLQRSFGTIFLVATFSTSAIESLILESIWATLFFYLFLAIEVCFLTLGSAIMIQRSIQYDCMPVQPSVGRTFVGCVKWVVPSAVYFTVNFAIVMLVEASLAHMCFGTTLAEEFGDFQKAIATVFMVSTLSASAIKGLLLSNIWLTGFFSLTFMVKISILNFTVAMVRERCAELQAYQDWQRQDDDAAYREQPNTSS